MTKKILSIFTFLSVLFFLQTHLQAATYCVDTASDEATVHPLDCSASCGTVAPFCSLREAITLANITSAADVIQFNIPGSAPHTIILNTLLPPITSPLTIDGLNGAELLTGSAPSIILQPGASAASTGLDIQVSNTTITGIQVLHFSDDGIRITGAAAATPTQNVLIGPSNVISGNGEGVRVAENANHITIKGNLIGTDATGIVAMGNQTGVSLTNSTHDDLVGGPLPGDGNVISGSVTYLSSGVPVGGDGINVSVFSHNNIIQGNKIGTDISGNLAIPNQGNGITFTYGPSQNQIGPNNQISGNAGHGIFLNPLNGPFVADLTQNKIIGNKIGTTRNGTSDLGNGGSGIYIDGTGPAPASEPNHVLQTQIGGSSEITLGGSCTGECNLIAFNGGDGVYIKNSKENPILGSDIFSNDGIGINLNGSSGNEGQAAPIITTQNFVTDHFTVTGTFSGVASQEHAIQLFSNTTCDGTAGQGEKLLASANFSTNASGSGTFSFDLTLSTGTILTATSTDNVAKNTSAFSNCFTLPAAPTPTPTPPPAPPADPTGAGASAGDTAGSGGASGTGASTPAGGSGSSGGSGSGASGGGDTGGAAGAGGGGCSLMTGGEFSALWSYLSIFGLLVLRFFRK